MKKLKILATSSNEIILNDRNGIAFWFNVSEKETNTEPIKEGEKFGADDGSMWLAFGCRWIKLPVGYKIA